MSLKNLRFSLRAFFIAVLVLGGGLGWLGSELIPIRQRQRLLARIKAAGGEVGYRHEGENGLFSGPPRSRHWLRPYFGDEALTEIEHVQWFKPLPNREIISLLDELPHVKTLVLDGPNVDDTVLARLRKIQELRELCLYSTSVTADGLAELGPLQSLTLSGTDVSDAVLARLDALQSVESLMLFRTSVTSDGMAPVGRLRNLQWLQLYQNHQIDARALETIASTTKLRELDCIDTPVGDGGLAQLRKLSNLRRLVLRLSGVTDDGMPNIAALTQIQHLNLIGSKISDAGLAELATLVHLEHLELGGTQAGDAGIAHLKKLRSLKSLDLAETLITDAALEHVGVLKELRVLKLDGTAITDDGLRWLQVLDRLERVSVGPKVTQIGVNAIKARWPICKVRLVGPSGLIIIDE